jgi:hypothetical protein
MAATSVAFNLSGQSTEVKYSRILVTQPDTYSLIGVTTGFSKGFKISATVTSFVLQGIDAEFTRTGIITPASRTVATIGKNRMLSAEAQNRIVVAELTAREAAIEGEDRIVIALPQDRVAEVIEIA